MHFTAVDADGYTDPTAFDLTVSGEFDFGVFGDNLPFTPTIEIGSTPQPSTQSLVATQIAAEEANSNQFEFDVAFDFRPEATFPIVPVLQDVVLGIGGLQLSGFSFEGDVRLAGYRLGENGLPIALAYGKDADGNEILVDANSDSDLQEPGVQSGHQVVGRVKMNSGNGASASQRDVTATFNGAEVVLAGAIARDEEQKTTTIELDGSLDLDGTIGFGDFLTLDSFGISGGIDVSLTDDLSGSTLALSIKQARTKGITFGIGELFEASATGTAAGPDGEEGTDDDGFLAISFSPDNETPVIEALSLRVGSPKIGLYGAVEGIDILASGLPDFEGLDSVEIGIEEGSMLDTLQDWFLPVRTRSIALDFAAGFFEEPIGTDAEGNPAAVTLLIDGAIGLPGFLGENLGNVGVDAEFEFAGLGIDVGKLAELSQQLLTTADALGGRTFDAFLTDPTTDVQDITQAFATGFLHIQEHGLPFTIFELGEVIDLSQLSGAGIELGFEVGNALAVRGALTVGRADANGDAEDSVDDIYYLAIDGALKVSSYGGSGTLVVTSKGPVAATVEFGVPIPLGPTTLTLGGGGGIIFGKDLLDGVDTSTPTINPADIPTPLDWELTDIETIEEIASGFWDEETNSLRDLWDSPATLAINGKLTSIAVGGLVDLDGTFAASLPSPTEALRGEGLSILGHGSLNALGLPMASGGTLVDARDPLNPTVSFGFRAPPKDNPLAFLFPTQTHLAGTLRTDGMIEGWLLGVQTIVEGAIDNASGPMAKLLDEVASLIILDRASGISNPLDSELSLVGEVTGTTLSEAILRHLNDSAPAAEAGEVIQPTGGDAVPESLASSSADLVKETVEKAPQVVDALWTQLQLALNRLDGDDVEAVVARIGEVFKSLFEGAADSTDDAVRGAYEAFNPSLVLRGAMQPTILGFEIGDPTNEVDLVINKRNLTLDLTASNVLTGSVPVLKGLGISDRLEIGFTADMPGQLIDVLVDPARTTADIADAFGEALNPFTGWEGKLAGSISILGFELGKVSGVVFGPQVTDTEGNATGGTIFAQNVHNFDYPNQFELTALNTRLPDGSEDKIPVYFSEDYDNMTRLGGLLLTGELNVPELLRDPVPAFEKLKTLTEETGAELAEPWASLTDQNLDLSDVSNVESIGSVLAEYMQDVVGVLTDETPLGTLQIYAPSPATLVEHYLDYQIPALVGGGDGSGETILDDRVPGVDAEGNPLFSPAVPFDPQEHGTSELRFADLNGNAFYDPRIDVLTDGVNTWSDAISAGSQLGDLTFSPAEDVAVPTALDDVPFFILNDVADDKGNGVLDPASSTAFEDEVSLGFVDSNHDGDLAWSGDPNTGAITYHESLVDFSSGSSVTVASGNSNGGGVGSSIPSPVIHYAFEGQGTTATDTAGDHDGELKNEPTRVSDAFVGKALEFDGANDYVVTNNTNLGGSEYSFSLWFKTDQMRKQSLLAVTDEGNVQAALVELEPDGQFRYFSQVPTSHRGPRNIYGGNYSPNAWHHLVAVRDGGSLHLYVDGIRIDSLGIPDQGEIDFETDLTLGSLQPTGAARPFAGQMDEVKVFDQALSYGQVRELYKTSDPGLVARLKPTVHYAFEGTGTQATDTSGSDHGILQGGVSRLDGALDFDGINGEVSAETSRIRGNEYSFSLWVNPDAENRHQSLLALTQVNAAGLDEHAALLELRPDGRIRFLSRLPTDTAGKNIEAGSYQANRWYHLVGVREADEMTLYVDGDILGTADISGQPELDFDVDITLGNLHPTGNHRSFNGQMDSVSLFNRALSAPEVRQLQRYRPGENTSQAAVVATTASHELTSLPNLSVFSDESGIEANGLPDGYTPPSESSRGDRIVGLNEGFVDINDNHRFDLGTDILYDLNGNGLPDGELFIDADQNGIYTEPEPLDDINGNGMRDVGPSLTEPFTDLNGNGKYDTGDPFLDLGNGFYDPPANPVFTFDSVSQQATELFETAYIDGFADVQLLGLNLGNGRLQADSSGLSLNMTSGPHGGNLEIGLGFREYNVGEVLGALADTPLGNTTGDFLELLLPANLQDRTDEFFAELVTLAGDYLIPFPIGSLDAEFELQNVLDWLDGSFGASNVFAQGVNATASLELYSPLFDETPPAHPTADPGDPLYVEPPLGPLKPTDDIQRYGGGRISATLNIPNFVEGAVGIFEAQFPNSPDDLLAPDFAFLAKADRLAIPGLSDDIFRANDLAIKVVKDTQLGASVALASVAGSVGVLEGLGGGISGSVDGALTLDSSGVYGHLDVSLSAAAINLGPNDRLRIGGGAEVRAVVNGTNATRTVAFDDASSVTIGPQSSFLLVNGEILFGATSISGVFQIQADASGITISGNASLTDSKISALLGPSVSTGIDVTFAAGVREASDGTYGVFLFDTNVDTNANLAIAQAQAAFALGFNTSNSAKTLQTNLGSVATNLGLTQPTIPGNVTSLLTVDGNSGQLFVSGAVDLNGLPWDVDIEGAFAAQYSLNTTSPELDLYADGSVDLGPFGTVEARGYLEIGGLTSAAGFFEIQASRFGVRDVAEFSGSVDVSFNTGRVVDIPGFIQSRTPLGSLAIPNDRHVKLQFANARLDLLERVAIGGNGSISLSSSSGLKIGGALGVQIILPAEVTQPFGGLVPSTVNLIGTVPSGSTSNQGLQSSTGNALAFPIDLDSNNSTDFTVYWNSSSGFDVVGLLKLGVRNLTAFGGLIGVQQANLDLRVNTVDSWQFVHGVWLAPNSMRLSVNGRLFVDATPGDGNLNDTGVTVGGSFTLDANAHALSVSGGGNGTVRLLNLSLVNIDLDMSAQLALNNGSVTSASLTVPNPAYPVWTSFKNGCNSTVTGVFNAVVPAGIIRDGLNTLFGLNAGSFTGLCNVGSGGLGNRPGPPEFPELWIPLFGNIEPFGLVWDGLMATCTATGLSTDTCRNGADSPTITWQINLPFANAARSAALIAFAIADIEGEDESDPRRIEEVVLDVGVLLFKGDEVLGDESIHLR